MGWTGRIARLSCALVAAFLLTDTAWRSLGHADETTRRYSAAPIWTSIFGENWREVWNEPVELPLFDLAAIGGGLTAERTVGGFQTAGLAFAGADGRSYTFRSFEKEHFVPSWLDWNPALLVLRDQTSANLPGADAVAARLARELGVPATPRRMGVLPDDPRLGEFRERFAGRAGTIAEYPLPGPGGEPGTFGATQVVSSAELWERARRGEAASVDAVAYLRARLLDWWIADFDRHPGQWRWARIDGLDGWQALPEDHDHAFPRYSGLVNALARLDNPWMLRFDEHFRHEGLVGNSRGLDAWLLSGLEREAWEREAVDFAERARDAIPSALADLPPAWRALVQEELGARLEERLAGLEAFALEVYRSLAEVVRVYGSDADDRAELDCLAEGRLQLTLWRGDDPTPWRRVLRRPETRRVEIFWLEGDDVLTREAGGTCGFEWAEHAGAELHLVRGVPAAPAPEPDPRLRQGPGRHRHLLPRP